MRSSSARAFFDRGTEIVAFKTLEVLPAELTNSLASRPLST
jgi:hypothetical protein